MKLIETAGNKFLVRFQAQGQEFTTLLSRVKAVAGRTFLKHEKVWEIPVSAATALDLVDMANSYGFTIHETAKIVMEEVAGRSNKMIDLSLGKTEVTDNFGMKEPLWPAQRIAVQYGLLAGNHINGDSPGGGKSPVGIALVDYQNLYPCLVVTTLRNKVNWSRLWQRFTDERSISIWTGDQRGNAKVDIIHWDMLAKQADYIINYRHYKAVIFDESKRAKDNKTQMGMAAQLIAEHIPRRYALCGKVIVNNMRDLGMQLKLVGRLDIFGGITRFMENYSNLEVKEIWRNRRRFKVYQYSGIKNEKQLYATLRANCFIGRTRREMDKDLPPVTHILVDTPAVSKDYKLEVEKAREELDVINRQASEAKPGTLYESSILEKANASIFSLYQASAIAKLPEYKSWLFDWIDCEEKIIVFAHHVVVQEAVASWFPNWSRIKAGQTPDEAQKQMDRFQDDPTVQGIVVSDSAGAEAITLNAASYMAILEVPMTEEKEEQMIGRMDRGQVTRPMTVYKLWDTSEDSVDRIFMGILEEKRNLGKINSTKYFISKLLAQ